MKKIKITQEQYKKIAKLINENVNAPVIPNMGKRVDKSFKQAFAGSDVKKFIKESDSDLKHETVELIKYLYRKSEDFSPFWAEHDLTYDDICESLESKGMIIKKDGKYELSKSLGSAEQAKQKLEEVLSEMVGGELTEYDNYNYPMGADADSNAPWNQSEPSYSKKTIDVSKEELKTVLVPNNEIAFLKDSKGNSYVFSDWKYHIDRKDMTSIADSLGLVSQEWDGDYSDGEPNMTSDENWDGNFDPQDYADIISVYASENLKPDEIGDGYDDFESGDFILVKMDDKLKQELYSLYDKDKKITEILKGVNEMDMGDIKSKLAEPFKQQPSGYEEKSPEEREMIKQRLAAIRAKSQAQDAERFAQRDAANAASSKGVTSKTIELPQSKNPNYTQTRLPFDETTSAGAIGGGTSVFGGGEAGARLNTPVGKFGEPLKRTFKEELNETTQGEGSIGQYDVNALPIGRNGEFKKVGKTKAETTPQWAGGAFVDFNDCTKLNNKPAGSGCSAGAVDNVVKLRKAKGSVNAPSLSENKIYETIAKKTGKSIEEVKRIIETKKNK